MSAEPGAPTEPGRAGFVISQLYYYVVAAVSVAFVLGGVIGVLFGIRSLVLPSEFEGARDAFRTMLHGLAFALPGAALLWWHLREARRKEGPAAPPSFWGRSLYFHLVAFVALWFAVGGVITALHAAVDLAVPRCSEVAIPAQPGVEEPEFVECFPEPSEAGRRAVDGAIFVLAAGPVWWWHLRQGRRAAEPAPEA
ncbi:MAG: DUF5671 domain-containing protein [Actinomycetota bacterium]